MEKIQLYTKASRRNDQDHKAGISIVTITQEITEKITD